MSLVQDYAMQLGKRCLIVSLLSVCYLVLGVLAAIVLRRVFDVKTTSSDAMTPESQTPTLKGRETRRDESKTSVIAAKLLARTCCTALLALFCRALVKHIAVRSGFDISKIKEFNGGVIIAFALLVPQTQFADDLKYLLSRRFNL